MREFTGRGPVATAAYGSLAAPLYRHAADDPDRVMLRHRVGGSYQPVTAGQLAELVERAAAGLLARGVGAGDRVAIMSRTRYEWTVVDYAIWTIGAVTVPVYETAAAEQVAGILRDSGAVLAVVESRALANRVAEARPLLPLLRDVLAFDAGALAALLAGGRAVSADVVGARRAQVRPTSLATIIYTSGTTGRPKGCELTHGALLAEVAAATSALPEVFTERASTLLVLPLAHVFARVVQCGAISVGHELAYAGDVSSLPDDLVAARPTYLLGAPRVFEKIQAYARNRAREAGRARVFAVAEATAVAYSRAYDAGGPSRVLRASHALCDRLVYRGVRALLGGRARFVISGGAPLDPRTGHFFRGAGLIVLEGWGLTETAAAATVNRVHNPRIGSVGQPLAGVTIRVEDDGEVLVRGPMVFTGYHGDEAGTRAVFDRDGFLRTGDLGRLDDDGFLTITGRKKELLVTAAGKNVAPAPLEERVRANPLVSQVLVVGDRRPFVACLVTIDGDAFRAWKARHRKPAAATVTDLRADPALRGAIQGAVDDANRAVSQAESIKVFAILPVDFSVSSGELTPTLKIRRGVILDRYSGAVDAIYGG